MKRLRLMYQLWRAGADKRLVRELAEVADKINKADALPALSEAKKKEIAGKIGIHPSSSVVQPRIVFATFSALLISTVIVSQHALPGSALYGVKRGTEEVRVLVQPGYKQQLVERREKELKRLQENDASEDRIERAQKEYEKAQKRLQKEQEDAADERADAIEDAQKRDANGDRIDSDLRKDREDDDRSGSNSGSGGGGDDRSGSSSDDDRDEPREGRDANGDRIDSDLR